MTKYDFNLVQVGTILKLREEYVPNDGVTDTVCILYMEYDDGPFGNSGYGIYPELAYDNYFSIKTVTNWFYWEIHEL